MKPKNHLYCYRQGNNTGRAACKCNTSTNEGKYTAEKAEAVKYHLTKLIEHKYKDYWLLYDYLSWLKNNQDLFYRGAKETILAYALTTQKSNPQSSHTASPDPKADAFFASNPTAKAQVNQMTSLGEQNETYIDKIKIL